MAKKASEIHVEKAASVSSYWVIVDRNKIFSLQSSLEKAMLKCRQLRGQDCTSCDFPSSPGLACAAKNA